MHYVKDAGVWKPVSNAYVKDAGVWKPNTLGYVKDAGVWKQYGYGRFTSADTVAVAYANLTPTPITASGTSATPPDANRWAIVVVYAPAASSRSLTINGAAATLSLVPGTSNYYYAQALVPTGTTITAVLTTTVSSGGQDGMVWVWSVIAQDGVPPSLGSATGVSVGTASTFSVSCTRPANGFVLGLSDFIFSATYSSVSGSAVDGIGSASGGGRTAGFRTAIDADNSADSQTLTVTYSGTVNGGSMYAIPVS